MLFGSGRFNSRKRWEEMGWPSMWWESEFFPAKRVGMSVWGRKMTGAACTANPLLPQSTPV